MFAFDSEKKVNTYYAYLLSFSVSLRANEFPESTTTNALASGLWMSSMSFGSFIGPSLGGIEIVPLFEFNFKFKFNEERNYLYKLIFRNPSGGIWISDWNIVYRWAFHIPGNFCLIKFN